MNTSDYEKMGAFYLGKEYDYQKKVTTDDLLLYKSKNLVTHGVVLGMTGSGKTGLCLSLLEEAVMDNIPSIIIDPKGDISNLLLAFPSLKGKDFKPWVNADEASKQNITLDQHSENQAKLWEKGLAKWGQDAKRIKNFTEKADFNIFTPGSNAGIPVSILSSLSAPDFEILDDAELFAEKIESSVTSILSLIGYDEDPLQSSEHIFLSQIFNHNWSAEKNLTLEILISQIQAPPFNKIGALDLEAYYPEKKRFELAKKMNNLIASPGFDIWLKGAPLDIQTLLFTEKDGKTIPRVSIFSIAHLNDTERMFFVSLLLNQMVSWMRVQSGTGSLRALLYMDEIFGYLPPTQNPPSKKPMMTLLKQARAFGLGVLLATQNPVDLDYKALSNIGTWFLGTLQTERDKMRVLDGLEGASNSQDKAFDKSEIENMLSNLGSRVFMLNNVHDDEIKIFHVRWAMSYLRGPITKRQIRKLMVDKRDVFNTKNVNTQAESTIETQKISSVPNNIPQNYLPASNLPSGKEIIYQPAILQVGEVLFNDKRRKIHGKKNILLINKISENDKNFEAKETIESKSNYADILENPQNPVKDFTDLPGFALNKKKYTEIEKNLIDNLYNNYKLKLLKSERLDVLSNPNESESEFRSRLQLVAREKRDELVEKCEAKYNKLIERAELKIEKAIDKLELQKAQSRQAKMNTAVSIGGALLGSLFGGRRGRSILSSGRTASRAWKEGRDVDIAERDLKRLEEDIKELETEMQREQEKIDRDFDPNNETFTIERISPYKKDITAKHVSLLWLPYYQHSEYELKPAFT